MRRGPTLSTLCSRLKQWLRPPSARALIASIFISCALSAVFVSPTYAQTCEAENCAHLSWTAPSQNTDGTPLTDLNGYWIWSGCQQSGQYERTPKLITDPGSTSHTVTGLPDGTCYFAATAINSAGVESDYSNEATRTFDTEPELLPGPIEVLEIEWAESDQIMAGSPSFLWVLSESSGKTASDETANGNDGTIPASAVEDTDFFWNTNADDELSYIELVHGGGSNSSMPYIEIGGWDTTNTFPKSLVIGFTLGQISDTEAALFGNGDGSEDDGLHVWATAADGGGAGDDFDLHIEFSLNGFTPGEYLVEDLTFDTKYQLACRGKRDGSNTYVAYSLDGGTTSKKTGSQFNGTFESTVYVGRNEFAGYRGWDGNVYYAAYWNNEEISDAELESFSSDPTGIPDWPAAGGTTVAVGQVTETDVAQSIAVAKTKSIGQVTEADLSQAVSAAKGISLNQVAESDAAQGITPELIRLVARVTETSTANAISVLKTIEVVQAAETSLAQGITGAKTRALAQVSEEDIAQAISSAKSFAVSQVAETDLAQAITPSGAIAVGQVAETDTAQAIGSAKQKTIGQVSETDVAQAVMAVAGIIVGQVVETNVAQAISSSKAQAVAQVVETDAALSIGAQRVISLAMVSETDEVFSVAVLKAIELGFVTESDVAQSITVSGGDAIGIINNPGLTSATTLRGLVSVSAVRGITKS